MTPGVLGKMPAVIQRAAFFLVLALCSTHAAARDFTPRDFLAAQHPAGNGNPPLIFHDTIVEGSCHLYFTFTENRSSSAYRQWTASRIVRELLPALDKKVCDDKPAARPGKAIHWTEIRRHGGSLAIHLRDMNDFRVDVDIPGSPSLCVR